MRYSNPLPKVTLTLYKKGKMVRKVIKGSLTRFTSILSLGNYDNVRIYVRYGYMKDTFGKKVLGTNSGTYDNKKDAMYMLRAFCEQGV